MERLLNLNPEELEYTTYNDFWSAYLRKWFKNYDITNDPYAEYIRIMEILSKDPSKVFKYGKEPFITSFKKSRSRKLDPSERKEVMSLVFLLKVPPAKIVEMCEKEFQDICGREGNEKFWVNYYKKWLIIDPFTVPNKDYYRKLKETVESWYRRPLDILRDGSEEYIRYFLNNNLDLSTKDNIDKTFMGLAKYGRLNLLKWFWNEFKEDIDIHAFQDSAFMLSVKNGHLDVLKWLWKISEETIDIHQNGEYAFRLASIYNHLDIMKWLWEISGETISMNTIHFQTVPNAVKNGRIDILEWLMKITEESGNKIDIHQSNDYLFRMAEKNEQWEVLEWLNNL